jgi:hypothetical protein
MKVPADMSELNDRREPDSPDPGKGKRVGRAPGAPKGKLVGGQIEASAGEEEAYQRAQNQAFALLDKRSSLGGVIHGTRDEWHER